jgi:hypothetical protein
MAPDPTFPKKKAPEEGNRGLEGIVMDNPGGLRDDK